jgi:hypothetical protein
VITRKALPRRTFLRGLGTAVALPFLDAMLPALARGQARKPPVRMAFIYMPNGMEMRHWNPEYEGRLRELPQTLKPLEPFRDDVLMLSNLTHAQARKYAEGGGHHGRCCAAYLTGVHPRKTLTEIKNGVSFDQLVANEVGGQMRFPSLELAMEEPRQAGLCDDGYSCAYTNNLAWKSDTQPVPPVMDPRALFERLFGSAAQLTPQERGVRSVLRNSILDFVADDTRKLQSQVGPSDRRKLDEYLTSIREIERQLEQAASQVRVEPGMPRPFGVPDDFGEHFKLMTDMITVAFQADLTRIVTFLVTREQSNRAYRELGISDGHHALTHHRYVPELMDKVARINRYHAEQFAKWVPKLKAAQDGEGSLLDHSMIVYGSGLADGNNHIHHDLPTLILGRANGYIKSGRRVVYRRETPMCNLWLTMMDVMGVHMERFGDSTGHLPGLDLA